MCLCVTLVGQRVLHRDTARVLRHQGPESGRDSPRHRGCVLGHVSWADPPCAKTGMSYGVLRMLQGEETRGVLSYSSYSAVTPGARERTVTRAPPVHTSLPADHLHALHPRAHASAATLPAVSRTSPYRGDEAGLLRPERRSRPAPHGVASCSTSRAERPRGSVAAACGPARPLCARRAPAWTTPSKVPGCCARTDSCTAVEKCSCQPGAERRAHQERKVEVSVECSTPGGH